MPSKKSIAPDATNRRDAVPDQITEVECSSFGSGRDKKATLNTPGRDVLCRTFVQEDHCNVTPTIPPAEFRWSGRGSDVRAENKGDIATGRWLLSLRERLLTFAVVALANKLALAI